jgi:hypothetical protein
MSSIIQLAKTNIDESTNIKPSNQTAQPTTIVKVIIKIVKEITH